MSLISIGALNKHRSEYYILYIGKELYQVYVCPNRHQIKGIFNTFIEDQKL